MKVTINGFERELHPVLGCTGYRAEAISLDDADLRELAKLSRGNLYATVQQLAARVPHFTQPDAPPVPVNPIDAAVAAGWIRHDGGECPVGPKDRVHFRTQFNLDNPHMNISEDVEGREADSLRWVHDKTRVEPWNDNIVVYRVVS